MWDFLEIEPKLRKRKSLAKVSPTVMGSNLLHLLEMERLVGLFARTSQLSF